MAWLWFALLSNLMYSFSNVIDQFIRKRHIKNDRSLLVIWMSIFFFIWLAIVLVAGWYVPPLHKLLAAVAAGFIIMFMMWIYVYAINHEEVSKVIPMLQFHAVFVLLFSVLFLGEALSYMRYAGFAVMFLSGLIMSVEKVQGRIRINRPLVMMTLASVILAATIILMKYFYLTESFWTGFFWFNIGGFLGTLFIALLPGTYRQLRSDWKLLSPPVIAFFVLTGISTVLGDMSYLFALKEGPASLVSVVGSTQIAMLFLLTLLLSRYFPKVLKEKTDRKTLLTKTIAIALMIIGLFLISGGI